LGPLSDSPYIGHPIGASEDQAVEAVFSRGDPPSPFEKGENVIYIYISEMLKKFYCINYKKKN